MAAMARRRLVMQEQEEFERAIAQDFSEERNELRVDQVTPDYGEHREALIRVRPGREDEARLVHMEFSEPLQWFLALLAGAGAAGDAARRARLRRAARLAGVRRAGRGDRGADEITQEAVTVTGSATR
jgi:hypothetical protein